MQIINGLVKIASFLFLIDVYAIVNFTIMDRIVVQNVLGGGYYKQADLRQFERVSNYLNDIHLLIGVFFFVTFLFWFYYAFQNIQRLDSKLYESKYWVFLAWFVPVFNLFLPFTMLAKMSRRTYVYLEKRGVNYGGKFPFGVFLLWWFAYITFLLVNFLQKVVFSYVSFDFMSNLNLFVHVLNFIGVVVCYSFIRHYIRLQEALKSVQNNEDRSFVS
ncbi:DUF4328 domain-containing protein [Myroides pelagicus]|uniref:DUF4328 domain-containing protein n=1 Tax=Myroides pelagicus TaxID=270914 RepID=A0A7K1GPV9_9FLAO|nr:DUF4328 domain-containing protein [Myroides pelagicus]MEC4113875.1 DUF4328 domain-containing protein [Myroides pelagicus]MTH30433.1 DUF4328 domain-containing protein [Myroides pelagicus]